MRQQSDIPWIDKDYRYIDFFRKSYNHDDEPVRKEITLHGIRDAEARREYHIGSIKQINHAVQFDQEPNRRLKEPQCEIYKITICFTPISKSIFIVQMSINKFSCARPLQFIEKKRRKRTFSKL